MKIKKCSLCGKEVKKLKRCSYCEQPVCKDCMVSTDIGKVCCRCNEDTARQLNWDEMELNLEEEEE